MLGAGEGQQCLLQKSREDAICPSRSRGRGRGATPTAAARSKKDLRKKSSRKKQEGGGIGLVGNASLPGLAVYQKVRGGYTPSKRDAGSKEGSLIKLKKRVENHCGGTACHKRPEYEPSNSKKGGGGKILNSLL